MNPQLFPLCFFLWLPGFAPSQCPPEQAIADLVATRDIPELVALTRQLSDCPDLQDSLAWVYHNLGVDYYQQGEMDQAIEATLKALSIRKQVLPKDDFEMGRSHRNLGRFHLRKESFELAEPHLKEAFRIYDQLDNARAVTCLLDLANGYGTRGDFELALNFLQIGLEKSGKYERPDYLASCYLDIGKILNEKADWKAAIDTLYQAVEIYRSFEEKSAIDYTNEANCFNNLAVAYDGMANYSRAIHYYQEALAINGLLENEENIFFLHNNIGVAYYNDGNFKAAKDYFDRALDWASRENNTYLRAYALDNLGDLELQQKQYGQAISIYQMALKSIIPGLETVYPTPEMMAEVSNKNELLTIMTDRAQGWRQWYDHSGERQHLENALLDLQLADQLLDQMRYDQQGEGSKLFWRKNSKALYEAALELCYQLQNLEAAYYFFEKSKSILLLESLLAISARELVPDPVAKKEIELQKEVSGLRQSLETAVLNEASHTGGVRQSLLAAQEKYQSFVRQLQRDYPQYHAARYASEICPLPEVREHGKELVHYFYGEEQVFMLRVGKDQLRFKKLDRSKTLDSLVTRFSAFVSSRDQLNQDPAGFVALAYQLFEKFYQPLWESQEDWPAQLIIIPDGLLNFIPFEALISKKNAPTHPTPNAYLLHAQSFQYAYSATVLRQQSQLLDRQPANSEILGMAPFANRDEPYGRLPYSAEEFPRVRGKLLLDEEATAQSFGAIAGDFSVVHLATHASAFAQGLHPYIAFADTNLYMPELYSLPLHARLIILSACESGLGKLQEGEGVMSLARAFSYSGTPELISSLWNVNDAATKSVLAYFYEHLQKGVHTTEALRLAKLDYLADPSLQTPWKTPYYWAGLISIGIDQPISLKSRGPLYWKVALFSLVGLLVIFLSFRFARF